MSTLNQKSNKVGCDGPDGLLRVHPENETCDVCGSAVSDEDVDVALREAFDVEESTDSYVLCDLLKNSIRAALEADRKRRAVPHVSGEPVAEIEVKEDGSQVWVALKTQWLSKGTHKLYTAPPAAQAVPNDDTGHEWATRHHLFIYEVDFGEEGKGRYIRLSDFNKVCEKLERAAQAVPDDMPVDLDTLIIRYGNARYDAGRGVDFARRAEHENLAAELYAEIAARLAAAPTGEVE